MLRYLFLILILAVLTAALTGCPREAPPPTQAPPAPQAAVPQLSGELTVFVPCGIAGPYGETKKLFEARYPGVKVRQELANIDVQTKLIADGKAQPDVWLALGDREMDRVVALGRVQGEPITYAYNSIALIVRKNNPSGIESLQDLAKPAVKTIALATESNSNGYYAMQAFKQQGLWDKLEKKLWLTDQPAMIKAQLASGKADVGVVYYPCTRETHIVGGQPQEVPGKLQLLGKIPSDISGPIPAQAAIIKGAKNPQAAQAFLDILKETAAQDVWEKFAFDRAVEDDPGRVTLYMYCGAGIRPMMDPAIGGFNKQKPNVRIDVGYAGSGCLLSQLTFSRRGDLYMPGESFYLDQARQRGYITASQKVGYFEPVLLVQKGNPKQIKTVTDLTKPGLKLGIGEPGACAVGVAAEALLKKAGMLEAVQRNIVFRAGNVPELGNAVKLKSLDVAIVWNVTAAQLTADCDTIKLDRALYAPSPTPIGMLKFTEHQAEAQAFANFLVSPEGQKIVAASGMTPAAGGY